MQHQLEIPEGKTNLTQVSLTTIFAHAIKNFGNKESLTNSIQSASNAIQHCFY